MRGSWQNSGLVCLLPWKGLLLYLLVHPQFWRCEVSGQAGFSADKCVQFLICLPKDCMQGIYFHLLSNWSKKHFLSTRDHYSGFTAIRPTQVVHDTCCDGLRDIQNVAKWSGFIPHSVCRATACPPECVSNSLKLQWKLGVCNWGQNLTPWGWVDMIDQFELQ